MNIYIFDTEKNKPVKVDKGLYMFEGQLRGFTPSWSSDSKWLAYSRNLENQQSAIFVYDVDKGAARQLTSGYYSDMSPEFDPEGKYLYYLTNRNLSPIYSDVDETFVYPNATQIAAASLRDDVPSPLAPRNDEVKIKEEDKKDDDKDADKDKKEDKKDDEGVKIDFDGFEDRVVILPVDAGNVSDIQAVEGKVIYHRYPNSGSTDKEKPVIYYDLEKREEKTIIGDADGLYSNRRRQKNTCRFKQKIRLYRYSTGSETR